MKWFNNLSVMAKLILSFTIVALFAGVVGLVGISNIKSISTADMMLYKRATLPIMYVGVIAESYQDMRVNLREILLYPDKKIVEKRHARIVEIDKKIRESLRSYDETRKYGGNVDAQSDADFRELTIAYDDIYKTIIKIAVTMEEGKQQEAVNYLSQPDVIAIVQRIEKSVVAVVLYNQQNAKLVADNNTKVASRAILVMSITIALAVLFAILLGYIISMLIKSPINKGLFFAKKLAAGDFTDRIDLDQKDELGQLGDALNTAADSLEKLIGEIIVAAQNLSQAVQEISARQRESVAAYVRTSVNHLKKSPQRWKKHQQP